jgi:hypothetical protein
LLFAALLISSTTSLAQNACVDLFINPAEQSEAVRKVVVPDGYRQWLLWEQRANVEQFRKQTTPVDIELVEMSPENVIIRTTADASADLVNAFRTSDGNIFWAKHPYNTHKDVPFHDLKGDESLPVYLTASRSLALDGRLRGFTIKLATNYPHGPFGERQDGKIKTNDDIDSALIHTNHMKKVDAVMGADSQLLMMGEVMTMAEKKTGIGMVVRDVRLLADGHYYLPALSIPHVGREIAALNGTSFEAFFEKYYAELLGEAKARLLLRYGLQMETPNSQNMLIQFDRQMRPTGKIVFRDVSDSFLVDAVANGLGYSGQIKRDMAVHYKPVKVIQPYWSNSSWRFDEAGDKAVTEAVLNEWGLAHDRAYVKYIEKELGLDFGLSAKDLTEDAYPAVYRVLSTDIGQRKLRQYRDRMIEMERARRRAQADAPARAS